MRAGRALASMQNTHSLARALVARSQKVGTSVKVSKGAKIRNRYNQVPHPTQDTNWKVTSTQSDTTNESQEVSPFPAGDHKAQLNIRAQGHSKHKTEQNIGSKAHVKI